MIIDHISQIEKYRSLGPGFESGINYLLENAGKITEAVSRHPLDAHVDGMVNQYIPKTAENAKIEAHNDYIDLQYMLKGSELVGWAPRKNLEQTAADPDKDFYQLQGHVDFFPLREGTFMIMFPDDAHQPSVLDGEPEEVIKVVLKIRVDESTCY